MHRHAIGFTLVELVVVLVLIGILAAYAAPKLTGRGGYAELTVQQDLIQSIRFAQQLAMSRTDFSTTLTTSATQINVQYNGAPVSGYPKPLPKDVTLSNSNLAFNRFGATNNANISISGPSQSIIVNVTGATGYAR